MKVTEQELIDIWKYFQYCCVPSIIMARYSFLDHIDAIKNEDKFYKFEIKKAINKVGSELNLLPIKLIDIGHQNIRYMNILGDNIDELLSEETQELYHSIYLSFKNAKFKHVECLSAMYFISVMLQIASVTFNQCCKDIKKAMKKDPTDTFQVYNIKAINDSWEVICKKAVEFWGYTENTKKHPFLDLNNPRCLKAVRNLRLKYANAQTLSEAMEKSYPWSLNYQEGVPYEKSADYYVTHFNKKEDEVA